jgi:hypothetical protein
MSAFRERVDADAQAICEEIKAATGVSVVINFAQAEEMFDLLQKTMRIGVITDPDEVTELVLGKYSLGDEEYTAYWRFLQKLHHRELGAKSSMNARAGKSIPFAPLSAYEEDIRAGRIW